MEKHLKLTASRNEKYELVETDEYIEVPFIVLKANEVMRPSVDGVGIKTIFSEKVLEKLANDLRGKPVLADHWESINKIVGVVSKAEVKDKYLIAYLRFPKGESEDLNKLIALLKLKPSPINQVSIGGYIKALEEDRENQTITITDFETVEVSLVVNGASPSTKRLDAKKTNKEDKSMDSKHLIEENTKLKASLEEKNKQIEELKKKLEEANKQNSELKAKLDNMELEKYKAEKFSEIPLHLQALAKPALEVANTKEAIDKIVEEYKKLSASQTQVLDVPDNTGISKKEENPFFTI